MCIEIAAVKEAETWPPLNMIHQLMCQDSSQEPPEYRFFSESHGTEFQDFKVEILGWLWAENNFQNYCIYEIIVFV